MKKVLITGGSGFLGRHLIKRLLSKYGEIKIGTISRNENGIARMLMMCHSERLKPVIGDIRDMDVVKYALREVDTVVHLAAMKHIDFCEAHPMQAITINVTGTINLLKFFKGDTFIAMSTDKAVEASSCYGATKLLLEKEVLTKAREDTSRRYIVIRSGNIFGSDGSVLEKWRQQIENSNEIVVTSLEMTRFFISVDTLSEFIVEVMEKGLNGNVYIPLQKAIILKDLATAAIALWGNKDTRVRVVGLRKGEKEHEKLFLLDEEIVTELEDNSSQSVKKMDVGEITNLLRASMK